MKACASVLDVHGDRARLQCDATSASCPSCAARGGCALQRLGGRGQARLEVAALAADGVRLVPGARVTVEVDDGELLGAAARTYLPPLVGLLAGPLLAGKVAHGGEAAVLLSALAGVLLGCAAARFWLRLVPPRIAVRQAEEPVHAA
jgi:positive regulator of sigma E activity